MTPLQQSILRAVSRRPMTLRELQNNLQTNNSVLKMNLMALMSSGEVISKDGAYTVGAPKKEDDKADSYIPCTLVKLAPRFGFAMRDDGTGDIFIPGRSLKGAMPGDKIGVRLLEHPRVEGSDEGEVMVITQPCQQFAGTVVRNMEDGRLMVEPDGCKGVMIAFDKGGRGQCNFGDKVGVKLTQRGDRHADHRCVVDKLFGTSEEAQQCAKAILYGRNIRQEFPPEVLAEAKQFVNAEIDPTEITKRMDLRGIPIFTIDSAETKDIDDAVSLQNLEKGGYELGVHIADVSHYVHPGMAMDNEALERATSIYYADKVIPMLPAALSNGICSLNEGVDRLAFSCLMQLDEGGNIKGYHFVKSVIRSRVKGVYKEINALMDGAENAELTEKYKDVVSQFPAMKELYEKRIELRRQRGGMEIESDEAKFIMDENGRCIDIVKRTRGLSECMIEEFMLLANQCAANAGRVHKVPFVYRVHEAPDMEKMEHLNSVLLACGVNPDFKNPIPTQLELAALLDETRNQPIQIPVHTSVLRSMQKARYAPQPLGHFSLVLADYAHFTSPIRRYPDLAIHRILTDILIGKPEERIIKDYNDFAAHASEQSSKQEVTAVRVERDVEDLYKAEYMHSHLGEEYEGIVSGVTPRGAFVELENTVEGFVPAAELCVGEPEVLDGVRIQDPLTGKSWMLGDSIRVRVAAADVALGRVDFTYLPESEQSEEA